MTFVDKVRQKVNASKEQVFLRRDFDELGDYRQVGRALARLQDEYVIIHAGHGVYAKPSIATKPELVIKKLSKKLGGRVKRTIKLGGTRVYFDKTITIQNVQQRLDRLKLLMAENVLQRYSIEQIRKHSLDALSRWKKINSWNPGYTEWEHILLTGSDDLVREIMTSDKQEPCNRLRQSPPYVDLVDEKIMEKLRETR
ncbi:MAG: hypothetical protein Q8N30_03585 [Methylococcales bacterium]|nr:hypothetical protein [Methylococcales bacterium]